MARERRPVFAGGKKVEYHFGKKDPHNKSFAEFIMSPQALKPTMQVAKAVERRAKQIAPRSGDGQRIPYADQFDLRVRPEGLVAGQYQNRRVVVELINRAGHAPSVEFGNWNVKEGAIDARTQLPIKRVRGRGHRTMLRAGTMYGDSGIMVSTSQLRGWGS